MPILLRAVALAHGGQAPVFEDLSLDFGLGWTGVAGPNGAGKSTLMAALAGALAPTSGTMRWPEAGTVAWVPQSVAAPAPAVFALAAAVDRAAHKLRAALGLEPADLPRWNTLSPGERRRWQVAGALAAQPAVLLLDEPTSHLDAESAAAVLRALRRFRGVGVMVSHDRAALDALVAQVVWIEGGRARRYPGGYTEAAAARMAEVEAERAELTARQGEVRRLAAQAVQARAAAAAAGRARRVGAVDPRDHDARSMGRKVTAGWAAARHARTAGTASAAHARLAATLENHGVRGPERARLQVPAVATASATWAAIDGCDLGPGGRAVPPDEGDAVRLLRGVELRLTAGDRIWIAGPNGAGKSTLLGALRARLAASPGLRPEQVLWLGQVRDAAEDAALRARLDTLGPEARAEVLARVAALGHRPEALLATPQPSAGQARALALALALGGAAAVVLLDEPTHELDLPAVERLEAALAAWPGTLVLVTHDLQLGRALTHTTWRVAGGRVQVEAAS